MHAASGWLTPFGRPEPWVSVVVPVRGRVAQLCASLTRHLEAARLNPEPVEGAGGGRLRTGGRSAAPAQLCVLQGRLSARSAARRRRRNLGVTRVRYDLLFFTESSCLPATDAIIGHVGRLCTARDPFRLRGSAGTASFG